MNPFLSVIIPIYKVEGYLENCVNSVINQNYQDLEIILVDDGSPDKCPLICDEFAQKDNRIKVIHKPNGGLSSARNAGIEMAKGEYLTFLDSDDQWNEGKLKPLIEQIEATKSELYFFIAANLQPDGSYVMRNDNIIPQGPYQSFETLDLYKQLTYTGNFQESACTKAINRDFLLTNNLFFKQGIIGEDTEWMFRVLRCVKNVTILSIPLFHNNGGRPGSITNTVSTRNITDVLSTIQCSIDFYKDNNTCPTKYYELAQCAYLWSVSMGLYYNIPDEDKPSVKKALIATARQIDLLSHPKAKKVTLLYKFCGFEITTRILALYIYMHKRSFNSRKTKYNG